MRDHPATVISRRCYNRRAFLIFPYTGDDNALAFQTLGVREKKKVFSRQWILYPAFNFVSYDDIFLLLDVD